MEQRHKEAIEQIITEMECPRDFLCYKSEFTKLCKARRLTDEYANCIEEEPQHCKFSLPFGYGYMCRCPLRVYAATNHLDKDCVKQYCVSETAFPEAQCIIDHPHKAYGANSSQFLLFCFGEARFYENYRCHTEGFVFFYRTNWKFQQIKILKKQRIK